MHLSSKNTEAGNSRIALIAPCPPFRGGIAHHAAKLFKALKQNGDDPFLIGFRTLYPNWLFPGKTQFYNGTPAVAVNAERLLSPLNPFSWWQVYRRIRELNPRIVVFEWWHPYFGVSYAFIVAMIRCFSRQRVVFICHNIVPHERHIGDLLMTRIAFLGVHRIIVHGETLRQQVLNKLGSKDVIATPHPLYDQFDPDGLTQSQAKIRLGLSGNVILFFGYVRGYKGLEYLLDAMPVVVAELDVTLVIAGEFYRKSAPYLQRIRELGIESHVVIANRYIPDEEVALYFTACDVVACPYINASQSGIVPLAYGFSKPVICTRVGSLPEAVLDARTGFLVEPRDPVSLAKGILAYYRQPDKETFTREIAKFRSGMGWKALVQAIVDV